MSRLLNGVIGAGVGLLVAAIILPIALTTMADANMTGVDATVSIVVTILMPILCAVGVALRFLPEDTF
ncbi:MAG: hypothetical protein A2Z74_04695 [Chloroflexi bacterium RBG_13_46_9]|nr:MAG: hypothetical protein A2Z74_04695 [Chloroflexi bacterium RBG_13_46_9]